MTSEALDNAVAISPLVNGVSLSRYIGKSVTLIGAVILVNNQGNSFDVKTPDLQIVTISLRKPLREPVTGVVEVQGVVKGKNDIICDYLLVYPKELSDTYDQKLTKEAIQIVQNVSSPWTGDN